MLVNIQVSHLHKQKENICFPFLTSIDHRFFRSFIAGCSLISDPSMYYRATSWPKGRKEGRERGGKGGGKGGRKRGREGRRDGRLPEIREGTPVGRQEYS